MKEYKNKEEYEEMVKEYNNFKRIYEILRKSALEIQRNMETKDVISYFCIIKNEEKTYITFYREDGKQLIQILVQSSVKNFNELFNKELIKETNVNRPVDDGYTYRGFIFNYKEEPYFLKQILLLEKNFEDADLIKEIVDELNYYKDKVVVKNNEVFDYTKTNNILNNYKFDIKESERYI